MKIYVKIKFYRFAVTKKLKKGHIVKFTRNLEANAKKNNLTFIVTIGFASTRKEVDTSRVCNACIGK